MPPIVSSEFIGPPKGPVAAVPRALEWLLTCVNSLVRLEVGALGVHLGAAWSVTAVHLPQLGANLDVFDPGRDKRTIDLRVPQPQVYGMLPLKQDPLDTGVSETNQIGFVVNQREFLSYCTCAPDSPASVDILRSAFRLFQALPPAMQDQCN